MALALLTLLSDPSTEEENAQNKCAAGASPPPPAVEGALPWAAGRHAVKLSPRSGGGAHHLFAAAYYTEQSGSDWQILAPICDQKYSTIHYLLELLRAPLVLTTPPPAGDLVEEEHAQRPHHACEQHGHHYQIEHHH